jgi:hypothetical protein
MARPAGSHRVGKLGFITKRQALKRSGRLAVKKYWG